MNPTNAIVLKKMTSKLCDAILHVRSATKIKYSLKIVYILAMNCCLNGKILSLQGICRNYFVYYCDHVVAMVTV